MTRVSERLRKALPLLGIALCLVLAAQVEAQNYGDGSAISAGGVDETAYGFGVDVHKDGMGVTIRTGNTQVEERADGSWTRYRRAGDWEFRVHNTGTKEYWFFDDLREVQKFDIRDPNTGIRLIGENPYKSNPFGMKWQKRLVGW